MKTLGEIAFDAYQRFRQSLYPESGIESQTFESLTVLHKSAWHDVANDVCIAYEDRSTSVKPCATQKELALADVEPSETSKHPEFTIYTDGGCWPNPGPGGWGFVCVETKFEKCGGHDETTNNRMEIVAVLKALQHHREIHGKDARLVVVSDSQYVVKACSSWIRKWKSKGWSRGKGELKNVDLWQQIDKAMSGIRVNFKWVRGHDGNHWNERADELAEKGARSGNE